MTLKSTSKFAKTVERLLMSPTRHQIDDYCTAIQRLTWQRHGIFIAAAMLAALYIDPLVAVICYSACVLADMLDMRLAKRVKNWDGRDQATARIIGKRIVLNTVLSALSIVIFVSVIALGQEEGGHFTPLFFLFAAALFCAMNNHQILGALIVRLVMYAAGFAFIAMIDVVRVFPPINHPIWLQFFTTVFVMYFILDVSRMYLTMYRENMEHLKDLEAEHKKTKHALQVKSNFVSTVSHELRTPLTSIKGSLDLIESGALGEVPEHLETVLNLAGRNCVRLSELINDILDVQSLEAGRFVSDFKPLCVEDLVEEAVHINFGFADNHGVYLDHVRADTETWILGDRRRLMQVITNLISNAVKFSGSGEVVNVRSDNLDSKVVIFVEDNGIGIPEDSQDKVFGQFGQIDNSDQRDYGGTGLGMNISKQIVELHRGVIDYVSEMGVGTTFMVALDTIEPPAQIAPLSAPDEAWEAEDERPMRLASVG